MLNRSVARIPAVPRQPAANGEAGPIRVLHVTEAAVGGIRSYLSALLPEQVRRGHDVHLLASHTLPAWTSYGIGQCDGVQYRSWRLDRRRPQSFLTALTQLNVSVRELRPDIVHLHSAWAGLFGRLPLLTRMCGVPVVYQPHAWSFELHKSPYVKRAITRWERLASARTEVLVTNCIDELDEGRRIGVGAAAHVLGVPVDTAHFSPVSEQAHWRRHLGISAPRVLVCIGRIARQKGQDLLVSRWEAAPLPDTALLLVGGGDPAELQALSPTQWGTSIFAPGEHADVRPFLWAADLLVLPSRYETVGMVVAEALACGRPVIATTVSGVGAAVVDGPLPPAGAVVSPGDMSALLDACAVRLADRSQWATECANARTRAEPVFRTAAVADRLDAAYRDAMARSGAPR